MGLFAILKTLGACVGLYLEQPRASIWSFPGTEPSGSESRT
jgi:hypothetical protein